VPSPFKASSDSGLFGRRSARALAALEAMLAEAECVRDVKPHHVRTVCEEHSVDPARHARGGRRRIYAQYLEFCLEDARLTDEEAEDLAHLREVLHLEGADVQSVHEEVGRAVYGRALADVLCDLEIDEDERAFLRRLRSEIGLSEAEAERLLVESGRDAHARALSQATMSDPLFARARASAGHFTGRSERGLEDAIRDGLSKARKLLPRLCWFEVERIAGYLSDEGARGWHVTLNVGLDPEDPIHP
jgi:flavin-binding protein dodecin